MAYGLVLAYYMAMKPILHIQVDRFTSINLGAGWSTLPQLPGEPDSLERLAIANSPAAAMLEEGMNVFFKNGVREEKAGRIKTITRSNGKTELVVNILEEK